MLTAEAMIVGFSFSIVHSPFSIVIVGGMSMGM